MRIVWIVLLLSAHVYSDGSSESSSSEDSSSSKEKTDAVKTIKAAGVSASIKKVSAEMELKRNNDAPGRGIGINLVSIQEVNAQGKPVEGKPHKFEGFAQQEFNFSSIVNGKYPGTDIRTKRITIQSELQNYAVFQINLHIIKTEGRITRGSEVNVVEKGDTKFDIVISKWPFRKSPKTNTGEYLDITLAVEGTERASRIYSNTFEPVAFSVGNGKVEFSKKVKIDGYDTDMALGFPTLEQNGNDLFRLRFPKFLMHVEYDPDIHIQRALLGRK